MACPIGKGYGMNQERNRLRPGYRLREKIVGYAFTLPAVLFVVLLVIYPLGYNVVLSFKNVVLSNFNGKQNFVGLSNYITLFGDKVFRRALWNTLVFTVASIVFQVLIGFFLALLFSKDFPLCNTARGLLMVCWLIPVMSFATLFKWLFAGDESGILNYMMLSLKLIQKPIPWLTNGTTAMIALIIANIWRGVPFNMMLISSGMTTIPADIYDACKVDGVSKFHEIIHITVPLLKPTLISTVTLGFVYTFKAFDLIYVMTGNGPLNMTQVLATLSYKYTFNDFNFSLGAAVADVMLLILAVVGYFNLKVMDTDEVAA